MFNELFNTLFHKIIDGVKLDEALSSAEIDRMREELATPEILPCPFDVTIDGWLARIELWGKINIIHKDPETFNGKRSITQKIFMNRVSDEQLTKLFGKWTIKKNNTTSCTFFRDYIGMDNKHYVEEFVISVDLKPELR